MTLNGVSFVCASIHNIDSNLLHAHASMRHRSVLPHHLTGRHRRITESHDLLKNFANVMCLLCMYSHRPPQERGTDSEKNRKRIHPVHRNRIFFFVPEQTKGLGLWWLLFLCSSSRRSPKRVISLLFGRSRVVFCGWKAGVLFSLSLSLSLYTDSKVAGSHHYYTP